MQRLIDLSDEELSNLISAVKHSRNAILSKIAHYPEESTNHNREALKTMHSTHTRYTRILQKLGELQ